MNEKAGENESIVWGNDRERNIRQNGERGREREREVKGKERHTTKARPR
jgi:hypothetical protein